jgi:undecaprenyl-diphosphatase
MEFFDSFLPVIKHLGLLGYWLVFFISFAESWAFVGAMIPGTIFVVLAGFLSAQGYFDLIDLIWFAAIGAMLGDGLSYWLGSKGTKFFHNENRILKLAHLEKGESFFKKHGKKSVFLGRFIGPIRPIIPFVAGLSKMNRWSFFFWNITSAFLWAISHLLLGYFFGGMIRVVEIWWTRASIFLFVLFLLLVILWFLIKKSRPFFYFLGSVTLSMKKAVVENEDVQNFVKKYPLIFKFIGQRLEKNKFFGLPLTLLCTAFVYIVFIFLGVIQDVLNSDPIIVADINVANLFFAFRDAELIAIFLRITLLANWQIVMSLALMTTALCWLWGKRIYIMPLWITIAGAELFNSLGKLVFHRLRPSVAYYVEKSFSFPSGHSTMVVAFYGFVVYLLFREIKKRRYKTTVLFLGIVIILAIGLSRLYLGEHFLSDVWGGYLLGLLWLIIGISITEWLFHKKRVISSSVIFGGAKIISALLILLELIFYTNLAIRYDPSLAIIKEAKSEIVESDVLSLFSDKKLSRFTETITGNNQEPLSFIVIAKDDNDFIEGMQEAGWYFADSVTFDSTVKLAKAVVLNQSYLTAPMTPSFWNTKTHDLGFEKPTNAKSARARHHARFWRTQFKIQNGSSVYVGTVSLDVGMKWGITHKIKPDIDTEREGFFTDLKRTSRIDRSLKIQFVDPVLGQNFLKDQFFTDGELYVIYLK